jgi:prevent-host-death family protein
MPEKKAIVIRRVRARDLWRKGAELLDEVELDGHAVLVTRHGRPVAMLGPITDPDLQRPPARRRRGVPPAQVDEDQDLSDVDLSPLERKILLELARRAPTPRAVAESEYVVPERATALWRLEMGFLIALEWGGYRITPKGAKLAERLGTPE